MSRHCPIPDRPLERCGRRLALGAAVVVWFLSKALAYGQAFTLVHEFSGREGRPLSGLIKASDGKLYGVLGQGGNAGYGSVYSLTPDGAGGYTYAEVYGATIADNASIFSGRLLEAADGGLYGTTLFPDGGLIFRVDPSGNFTVVHRFPHAGSGGYLSPLIQLAGGAFYGVGGNEAYRMDVSGNVTSLHTFSPSEGVGLAGPLLHASDGFLYGVCVSGGIGGRGTVYRMDLSGSLTVLYSFSGPDGAYPGGGLIEASDGFLYGLTGWGGAFDRGSVFRMDKGGTLTTLHSFAEGESLSPQGTLLQASDGNFYGATYGSASDPGTLFRVDSSGTFATLHAFSSAEGTGLNGSLVEADGQILGTAWKDGGTGGYGTAFVTDLSGNVQVVYSFLGAPDGISPNALIQASDGLLYGTCVYGGQAARGTLFQLDFGGNLTRLHSFDGPIDGGQPQSALIEGSDGHLYGTAGGEGAFGHGTVFRSTTDGLFATLHAFSGVDGDFPYAALVEAADGNLYGTTYFGGAFNLGTAYRIDGTGPFATLHDFGGEGDGQLPSGLVQASDGDFYGSAANMVFRMNAAGEVTPVLEMPIFANRLLIGPDGNFYGASATGLFRMDPAGGVSMLHTFQYGEDITYPGELIEGPDGLLYGTGLGNGETTRGSVFRVDLEGNLTVIHQFQGSDGGDPRGRLLKASDGFLYGTTTYGGQFQGGVTYRIDPAQVVAVETVSPASGPAAGGTSLTIAGAGFQAGATVTIGSVAASVVVSGTSQIQATSPALEAGAAYDVVVANPDLSRTMRARAWVVDAVDVPADDLFHEAVRRLFSNGVTVGCGDGLFCLTAPVSRAQAAVLILKSMLGAGYAPPLASGTVFADVPWDAFAGAWIEDLAARGISAGCGGGNYCPDEPVTRAEMAPLLLKASLGAGYAPPGATGVVFGDVPTDAFAAAWIEDLSAREIAAGCHVLPALYCPTTATTRGQMAALLVSAFGLH